jgi:lipase maturation factor 1
MGSATFVGVGLNDGVLLPAERSIMRAVQFIETDGAVFSGAEAVFQSLAKKRSREWMLSAYRSVPGFAGITEATYGQIARHRVSASFLTRVLWGNDVRPPTYFQSGNWFLRSLGLIYLIAFVSIWVQVDGLIGEHGILPVANFLSAAGDQLGDGNWLNLPTLCWLNSSNAFLHFLCGAGVVVSIFLIAGITPVLSLLFLFVFYLSLTIAGQTFLRFQWDILLLETGFLAIFFVPLCWWMRSGSEVPVSRIGHFLLKVLLFKLMLMSGVVKLTSGDDSWWNLTALDYHYETQPLPTIIGWWAHQSPEWFRKGSTFFVLFVETVLPFFIWGPRRLRHLACGLFILLQVAIGLTGNYCFFNLLTIVLCLPLIDDTYWRRRPHDAAVPYPARATIPDQCRQIAAVGLLAVLLPINGMLILSAFKPRIAWPESIQQLYGVVEPFQLVSGYGLFRVMTKSRPEIIIEGSADGVEWQPYEFKWKPGDLHQPPRWVAPHQPRLDWQMWFAALGTYRHNPWFLRLTECLLRNEPAVTQLLARNPFPNEAPRYVRAKLYQYHFTTVSEHRNTGDWWKRGEEGEYLPEISLKEGE